MERKVQCLIIGGGPAGYTAGIYASRAGLAPLLVEGMTPGGQLTITNDVENFPGYPEGKSGPEIMEDIRNQALRMGTKIVNGEIREVDCSRRPFRCLWNEEDVIVAETVIVATGATAAWLNLDSESEYRGFGVSACATCDGFFYRKKTVAVVGGGDTAVGDALYLSHLCEKVYLIHRRDALRASQAMQEKLQQSANVEIVWNAVVEEVVGVKEGMMKKVTGVKVRDKVDNSERLLAVDGLFVAIGHTPVTQFLRGQLELDERGYIRTVPGTSRTSVAGVFAAGDVQDPHYRQAITAAASGCVAALEAERFLKN